MKQLMKERACAGYDFFNMLLTSQHRTTDLLETWLGHKLKVQVIEQKALDDDFHESRREALSRETILFSAPLNLTISHNHVILYPELLPYPLNKKMLLKEEGIGEVIRNYNLGSERNLIEAGYKNRSVVLDLFRKPLSLQFSSVSEAIPFKEYTIQFRGFNSFGMKLAEYFNPDITGTDLSSRR